MNGHRRPGREHKRVQHMEERLADDAKGGSMMVRENRSILFACQGEQSSGVDEDALP